MSRNLAIVLVLFGICVGFGAGWFAARGHRHTVLNASQAAGSSQFTVDCDQAPDSRWNTVRSSSYIPAKTLYGVEWQFCSDDVQGHRVRVTDDNLKTVFFQYRDDQILRVETLDLLGLHDSELLVMTGSAGTDDRESWHIIGQSNGKLIEWKMPNYDAPAVKLLRPDEDFCCKEWNFHLKGSDIFLARGIYHKGEGNCCPSRGGVLARLKPSQGAFALADIERISKSQYDYWKFQPFCLKCALTSEQ